MVSVNRLITSRLRELHLSQSAGWHLCRSRLIDPPAYIEDVIYERKVRMPFEAVIAGTGINPAEITAAAGFSPSAFSLITVLGIEAWGPAGDGALGIRVRTNVISGNIAVTDRDFDDFGTVGARRAHVKLSISAKDQSFLPVTSTLNFATFNCFDELGVMVAGHVLVDFRVQFKNNSATVRTL